MNASSTYTYRRPQTDTLAERLREQRQFLQILTGSRQVGKTTLARQAAEQCGLPYIYATADEIEGRADRWLEAQWRDARLRTENNAPEGAVLIVDEVQKVVNWPETVKYLWDTDTWDDVNLKVVLLGSDPLRIQRGVTESMAGRFEMIHLPHWSFAEMREAFDWTLQEYLFYGAYPGSAKLINRPKRWAAHICGSLIETTITRDILSMTQVNKPALLRQLFELSCTYSGQILSYNKMLGQLQDAGNTTTLAHYLELLSAVGMVAGLQKYTGNQVRQRSSSPKLLALNTALMTAPLGISLTQAREDGKFWGRLVKSAVGAHLWSLTKDRERDLYYWRENSKEVDFVVRTPEELIAIEVKSGRHPRPLPGLGAFMDAFEPTRTLIVGGNGLDLEDFLLMPPEQWLTRPSR